MWQLKKLEIQNPAGLLITPELDWKGKTYLFGPQREILFIALSQRVLRPDSNVSLGFNPRAQMFMGLQSIFALAEKLLSLSAVESDESKIGALVSDHTSPAQELQISSVQKMLRAEVIMFVATISVSSTHLPRSEVLRVFEYLSSVNSQTDEMLPIMVEQALGKDVREVFELVTSQIFFYRTSSLAEVRHKLYDAERLLCSFVSAMKLPDWKSNQGAVLLVQHGAETDKNSAVFVPYNSASGSNGESRLVDSVESICKSLLQMGVMRFYVVDTFVERLRWIERIATQRQRHRIEAVRGDPLRAQGFFDARAGRNGFIVLSDRGYSKLHEAVAELGLLNFDMDVQEMIATSLEVSELRNSAPFFKDPRYDLVELAQSLIEASKGQHPQLNFRNLETLSYLFQLGQFPKES